MNPLISAGYVAVVEMHNLYVTFEEEELHTDIVLTTAEFVEQV